MLNSRKTIINSDLKLKNHLIKNNKNKGKKYESINYMK